MRRTQLLQEIRKMRFEEAYTHVITHNFNTPRNILTLRELRGWLPGAQGRWRAGREDHFLNPQVHRPSPPPARYIGIFLRPDPLVAPKRCCHSGFSPCHYTQLQHPT